LIECYSHCSYIDYSNIIENMRIHSRNFTLLCGSKCICTRLVTVKNTTIMKTGITGLRNLSLAAISELLLSLTNKKTCLSMNTYK